MANPFLNGDGLKYLSGKAHHQASLGFAYVLLLALVALIGVISAFSLSIGSTIARRDAEKTLLAIGNEFEVGLRSYSGVGLTSGPVLGARGPRSLNELLRDSRSPEIRRYLRKIYADPLTGKEEWGVVRDPEGFILGVYSLSNGVPIQQSGFEPGRAHFERAETYSAWVFGLQPAIGQGKAIR